MENKNEDSNLSNLKSKLKNIDFESYSDDEKGSLSTKLKVIFEKALKKLKTN